MAANTSTKKPVSAFDLFNKSWEVVQRNLKNFIILSILPIISALASMMRDDTDKNQDFKGWEGFSGITGVEMAGWVSAGIIAVLLVIVVSLIVQTMSHALELEGAKGKTPTLNHLWELGKKFWLRMFGLYIIWGLMIVGGLLLLIIPGFIVIRRYIFAPYILIEKDLPILKAMEESANLSKPYSWSIYAIVGVSILLSLTGIIPVIGSLISLALTVAYSVAPALRYEELKSFKKPA